MINEFDPQWRHQLYAMANEQGKTTYLLVDGVCLDKTLQFIREWPIPVAPQCALFYERADENDNEAVLAASPWLLPYPPELERTGALLAAFDALPAIICIRTGDSRPALLARLKRWTIVSCGDMQFNFRFTDTRRLPAIHRVLTPEQRVSLFGNHDQWAFMNRQGQWELLALSDADKNLTKPEGAWHELQDPALSDDQFAALLKDSEPDEIIAAIWEDLPTDCPTRTASRPADIHQQTLQALIHADRLGLTTTPDRLYICLWVLKQYAPERLVKLQSIQELPVDHPVEDVLMQLDIALKPKSPYA